MPRSESSTPPPPPRKRKKHRLLKLTITLLIALAIVGVAVELFLQSDYPRQIAVKEVGAITGLRVEIGKLQLTWSGHTTIDNLNVSLPLADQPFLVVPHIDAQHTSLLGTLFTLNVDIDRATIERPEVNARQGTDGVWNLQKVLDQLATPGKNAAARGVTQLPNVDLKDAVLHITKADGKTLDVTDIALTGQRRDALVWTFDAHAADFLTANGEVSAGGRWPHKASVIAKPIFLKTLEPLVGPIPIEAKAELNWQGERTPTGITGRLTMPEKTTQAGPAATYGAMKIVVDGGDVTASPDNFTIAVTGLPPLTLAGGTAKLEGSQLTLAGVRTRFANGSARLDGSADLVKQHGHLTAAWEQIAFPVGTVHQGTFDLEAANIWPGRPWVKGNVSVLGQAGGGTFETQAAITGDGLNWGNATYVIDLPVLRYSRQSELRINDIRTTLHATGDTVELTDMQIRQSTQGPATLAAHGVYHFADSADAKANTGYFTAVGNGFQFAGRRNLGFNINAWVDSQALTMQTAFARLGPRSWVNLYGQYVFSQPEPIAMQLDFDTDPKLAVNISKTVALAGHANGSFKVGGTISPPHVTLQGNVATHGLKVNQYLIGDADLLINGMLDQSDAEFRTEHLHAFGGEGWFGGDFVYFSRDLHTWSGFSNIDLAQIDRAVGLNRVTGLAAGKVDLHIPVEDFQQMYGDGEATITTLDVRPGLSAQTLHVPISIGDGYVSLTPRATQVAGGTADVKALLSLDDPTKFKLVVNLENWLTKLPIEEFSMLTTGKINLPQFDLGERAVSGSVAVKNQFFAHAAAIGEVSARLKADGQQIQLQNFDGQILGGGVTGKGSVNFGDLTQAQLNTSVTGLSLDRLTQLDPRLTGMKGQLTITVDTHAADGPSPLGPLQTDINILSDQAMYKSVQVGDSQVRIYADKNRIALADDPQRPNLIGIAGGLAKIWGRVGHVPGGPGGAEQTSAFASVHLDGIDTEQIDQMIDPDGKTVPGKVSGDVIAYGNIDTDLKGLSGHGQLNLTDSDLANVGPIAVLYDAMHLSIGSAAPQGHGSVAFRLNGGRLDVTGLDYFNRGVYARGAITLENVTKLKNSPVDGYMLGTFRPLKDIKLPFLGTLDSILDALQASATTIKIEGTMEKDKLQATPVSLKRVSSGLKNILVGEAQAK